MLPCHPFWRQRLRLDASFRWHEAGEFSGGPLVNTPGTIPLLMLLVIVVGLIVWLL